MLNTVRSQCLSLSRLAVPQLVRRKTSGRYVMRLREVGSVSSLVSIGLRTTNRHEAVSRMNELSQTAKAFLLDNPEATRSDLNDHLKSMALSFLTDKVGDYWSGLEVDHLGDAAANLKTLALGQLTVDQQEHIVKSLEVLKAAQLRVHEGDTQGLFAVLSSLNTESGGGTSILEDEQGDYPTESTEKRLEPVSFSVLVDDLMIEKRQTLKAASVRDLESTLKTVAKYLPEGTDLMSRPEWLTVRDAMVSAGLAASTINKAMTKAKMLLDYGLMNKKLEGRNPIERLKLTGAESQRKAFSVDQLEALKDGLPNVVNANQRYLVALGLITGARVGELTQLYPEDIKEVEGHWCIDINDNNGKTVKNKASIRVVPLTDGAYGFNLQEFLTYVAACPTDKPVLSMTRDTASKWFNENYMRATLSDAVSVSFHSLRHSMASTLKAAGVSLTDAQGILGHSSQSITFDLYGKGHAVQRLSDALGKALMNNHSL